VDIDRVLKLIPEWSKTVRFKNALIWIYPVQCYPCLIASSNIFPALCAFSFISFNINLFFIFSFISFNINLFLSSLYKWSCLHISLLNPCLNEVEAYPTTRLLPLLCSTFLTNSLLRLFCYLSATCQLTLWNIIGSRLESLNRTFNWQDVFWASKCHHCSIFELYKWTIGRSCKWNLPSCSFEDEGTERVSTSYRPNLFWSSFFFFFLIFFV